MRQASSALTVLPRRATAPSPGPSPAAQASTTRWEVGTAITGAPQLRREFWQAFKVHMGDASSIGCSRVSSDGWMWHSADLSAGYLASLVNVRLGEIGVRFRLNEPNADSVFSFLETRRPEIDAVLEPAPSWRRGDGGSHVIEARRAADILDRASWPKQMTWLARQLEAFQRALWPFVGRIPPRRERRLWDEELFFRELSAWNPTCLEPATVLLRWAQQRGDGIQWGRGGQSGSFTPTVSRLGFAYQLAAVRTDGTLHLLFARLKDSPLYADRLRRLDLLAQVNKLPHLALPDETVDHLPTVPLAVLSDLETCAGFVELLDWFHDSVVAR